MPVLVKPNCYNRGYAHFEGLIPSNRSMAESMTAHYEVYFKAGKTPFCCKAYPDGIPREIAYGDDKHLKVRDDQDNDIIFK